MTMNTAISEGVEISVKVTFRKDLSQVEESSFFFNYEIKISNKNSFPIQLLLRHWYIFDSLHEIDFVSGEGVVGEQPILKPGETYSYMSGCGLNSEFGYMKGFYIFRNLNNHKDFQVFIPKFNLEYNPRLN